MILALGSITRTEGTLVILKISTEMKRAGTFGEKKDEKRGLAKLVWANLDRKYPRHKGYWTFRMDTKCIGIKDFVTREWKNTVNY